jgi:glycosyltransferase involved in cell wall biosynthesis
MCSIPDQEIGWLLPAISRGLNACWREHPDVIYSSAPPWTGHLVAGVIASLTGRPWVADFRDPWARAPWRSARMLRFEKRAAEMLERLVVTTADALMFTTRAARDEFVAHHGDRLADKCHVVRNGCDPATFDGVEGCPPKDRFVLMHAGSLYGRRNPIPLLRAVASAARHGRLDPARFRLRFVGTVADVDLGRAVSELGLDAVVECVPRVSHRESLVEIRSASALLLLQPGTTMSVPAKTFEYLAAGRPVLALAEEGETAEIVRASGIGVAVAPADEAAIEQGLLRIIDIASGSTAPVPRDLYDGGYRSAEMMAILAQASTLRDDRPQVVTPRRGWARWGS